MLLTVEVNLNVDGTLKQFSRNGVISGGVGILATVASVLFCLPCCVLDRSGRMSGAVGILGWIVKEFDSTDIGL